MNSDARWIKVLAWRLVVNTFIGTVAAGIAGELALGLAGISIAAAFAIVPAPWSDELALRAVWFGAASGALIFVIATLKSAPGEIIAPVRALLGRVILGQLAGTLLACSAFLAFEILKAQTQPLSLAKSIGYDAFMLTWFGPPIMACGAIAGALTKRDWPETATLNAA